MGQAGDVPIPFVTVQAASGERAGTLSRVATEIVEFGEIPQDHRVVEAAGGQGAPMWVERRRQHHVTVAGQRFADDHCEVASKDRSLSLSPSPILVKRISRSLSCYYLAQVFD
jgi:hypothetical protein